MFIHNPFQGLSEFACYEPAKEETDDENSEDEDAFMEIDLSHFL